MQLNELFGLHKSLMLMTMMIRSTKKISNVLTLPQRLGQIQSENSRFSEYQALIHSAALLYLKCKENIDVFYCFLRSWIISRNDMIVFCGYLVIDVFYVKNNMFLVIIVGGDDFICCQFHITLAVKTSQNFLPFIPEKKQQWNLSLKKCTYCNINNSMPCIPHSRFCSYYMLSTFNIVERWEERICVS